MENMKSIQRNNSMNEKQYLMSTGGGPSESCADIAPETSEIVPTLMTAARTVFSSNFIADEIARKRDTILAEQRNSNVDMGLNDYEIYSNIIYHLNEIDNVVDNTLEHPRTIRKGSSNTEKTDFHERKLKLERIRIMENEEELANVKLRHEGIKNQLKIAFLKEKQVSFRNLICKELEFKLFQERN